MGRPASDLKGQRFGKLVVIEKNSKKARDTYWDCICDCGNKTISTTYMLTHDRTKSCGCFNAESKLIDVSNKRFGRLVAIERIGYTPAHLSIWKCKCDCGNFTNVRLGNLQNGQTQSCGCLHKETFKRRTHGYSSTRLYRIWKAMRERCSRPEAINYQYYGAKGITVCEEWNEFMPFREWAISNGYADNLVIDRIDSDKDYAPSNCRWITQSDNAREAVKVRERKKHDYKVEVQRP